MQSLEEAISSVISIHKIPEFMILELFHRRAQGGNLVRQRMLILHSNMNFNLGYMPIWWLLLGEKCGDQWGLKFISDTTGTVIVAMVLVRTEMKNRCKIS